MAQLGIAICDVGQNDDTSPHSEKLIHGPDKNSDNDLGQSQATDAKVRIVTHELVSHNREYATRSEQ